MRASLTTVGDGFGTEVLPRTVALVPKVHAVMIDVDEVVLRRKAAVAAWWSMLGISLLAAGVFFVIDTQGHPVAWVLVAAFSVPSLYFLLQLVFPSFVEVRLGPHELRSRSPFGRRTVAWDDVHLAKVGRIFGDPVLVIDLRRPDGDTDRVRVPLPVGVELDRLHEFLRERLGRGSRLSDPGPLHPPDL